MALFNIVPIIDVTRDNFCTLWPSMLKAVKDSTFVALDTELSGLGDRKKLNAKSFEDRFKEMVLAAQTRSVLSIGMSCFKLFSISNQQQQTGNSDTADKQSQEQNCSWSYIVQTYNITCLCDENYVVEPAALRFLVEHGFDFNKQYSKGVAYHRGCDSESDKKDALNQIPTLRQLFTEIVKAHKAVTFHNALMDVIFLYHNFYSDIPISSSTFLADLCDLFPEGIYDTKFITDYFHKMPASYLEYVFRKCYRDNMQSSESHKSFVSIKFPSYPAKLSGIIEISCPVPSFIRAKELETNMEKLEELRQQICMSYAGHGWCGKGNQCRKSHDVDLVLDLDQWSKTRKYRKRKRREEKKVSGTGADDSIDMLEDDMSCSSTEKPNDQSITENVSETGDTVCHSGDQNPSFKNNNGGHADSTVFHQNCMKVRSNQEMLQLGGHRAGYDAFMTGYILASYVCDHAQTSTESLTLCDMNVSNLKNSIYLTGKDHALSVTKSSFAKNSKEHKAKLERIKK